MSIPQHLLFQAVFHLQPNFRWVYRQVMVNPKQHQHKAQSRFLLLHRAGQKYPLYSELQLPQFQELQQQLRDFYQLSIFQPGC